MYRVFALLFILTTTALHRSNADEDLNGVACRSVTMWYSASAGTGFYNEVTVVKTSDGTYFCVCGWNNGYFGIQQVTPEKKVVLFSIWDAYQGDNSAAVPLAKQVKVLQTAKEVKVERFGNEGTGYKSTFAYDWKVGQTYRLFVRAKADGPDRTAYSGYFYIPETKKWKHFVTFSTLTNKDERMNGYYSFVEDFLRNKVSATVTRRAEFGNGWVKSINSGWVNLKEAKFTADSNTSPNINAGNSGQKYFLETGGNTINTSTKLNEVINRRVDADTFPLELPVDE